MNQNSATLSIVRAEGSAAAFLADAMKLVVERALVPDIRFVEIVPPGVLASHLADRPEHRADVLLDAQGIKGKEERDAAAAALGKIGVNTTAELLTTFLENGPATPEAIRGSVTHDDWPKILSAPLLWKFISDGNWFVSATDALTALLALLDKHKLITPRQKYDQIGLEELIRDLPQSIKDSALRIALMRSANEGKELELNSLFELATPGILTHCMKSSDLWEKLVLFVAGQQGWLLEPATDKEPVTESAVSGATMTPPGPVLDRAADQTLSADAEARTDDAAPADPKIPAAVVDEKDIDIPEARATETDESPKGLRSQPPPKPKKGDSDPPKVDG